METSIGQILNNIPAVETLRATSLNRNEGILPSTNNQQTKQPVYQPTRLPNNQRSGAAIVYRFTVASTHIATNVVVYEYDIVGKLLAVLFSTEATPAFISAACNEVPVKITIPAATGTAFIPPQFSGMQKAGCQVRNITNIDLSFTKFWDTYNNKMGDKRKIERKWQSLSEIDKIMALGMIPRLRRYYEELRLPFVLYPATYLNQRRWENFCN